MDDVPDVENITAALKTGPYGRCAYECDNDVCDNQVSRMRRSAHPASGWSHLRALPSHHLHTPLSVRAAAQVVNFEFSSGATASFTMVAHTQLICERQTRLHFAHGELVGDMSSFTVTDFRTRRTARHTPRNEGGGHGGGDLGLISTFVDAVRTGQQELLGTDVSDVLRSHLAVFAAEKSRREGIVVDCVQFEKEAREKYGRL